MANIAGAQKQIRDIVWNDIASGDVPYVLRDIVQELADSGHTEIAANIKRAIRTVKVK